MTHGERVCARTVRPHPRQATSGEQLVVALNRLRPTWESMTEADRAELFVACLPARPDDGTGSGVARRSPKDVIVVLPSVAAALGPGTGLWVLDLPPGAPVDAFLAAVLKQLGVQDAPPLPYLLNLCVEAPSLDTRLRRIAFLLQHTGPHKAYAKADVAATTVAYLPGVPPPFPEDHNASGAGAGAGTSASAKPKGGRAAGAAAGAGGGSGSRKRARPPSPKAPAFFIDDDGVMVLDDASSDDDGGGGGFVDHDSDSDRDRDRDSYAGREAAPARRPADAALAVVLCAPGGVFEHVNPFAPSLHPAVAPLLASSRLDASDLGVKAFPSASVITAMVCSTPPRSQAAARALFQALHLHASGVTNAMYAKMGASACVPLLDSGQRQVMAAPTAVFVSVPARACAPAAAADDGDKAGGTIASRKRPRGATAGAGVGAGAGAGGRAPLSVLQNNGGGGGGGAEVWEEVDDSVGGVRLAPGVAAQLLQYVDLGPDANAFLLRCGAKVAPSAADVAHAVAARGETLAPEDLLATLKALAAVRGSLPKAAVVAMGKATCLVGVRGGPGGGALELARASDVFLDDDPALAALLQPLVAPAEALHGLYRDAGAKWLSSSVTRSNGARGSGRASPLADALLRRLLARQSLLQQSNRGVRFDYALPTAAKWLASLRVR
jgi:hypothetical protein